MLPHGSDEMFYEQELGIRTTGKGQRAVCFRSIVRDTESPME